MSIVYGYWDLYYLVSGGLGVVLLQRSAHPHGPSAQLASGDHVANLYCYMQLIANCRKTHAIMARAIVNGFTIYELFVQINSEKEVQ